jgi:transcriptional regulator with XRE-family HTH domain
MADIRLKILQAVEKYQAQFPPGERPTQVKIAVDAGISPATLSRYVNGKAEQPSLKVLAKLCAHMGIKDMNEMFELIEEES